MLSAVMPFLGGVIYTLIAVRFGFVLWRNEKRIGRNSVMVAILMAVMWPVIIVLLGFGVAMDGDPGIFDSQYKFK